MVSGVAYTHSQWLSPHTRQPVSSGVTTGLRRTCSHSAAYAGAARAAVRCSSWTRPPLVTRSPNWVSRTRATFSSGMPSSVCKLHHQRDDVRTQLGGGGAQRVGGLQRVPVLHAPPTLRAAADLDVEPPHEGLNRWQLFLILRRHTVHGDRAAAVGTTRWDQRRVDLVDARGRPAPPVLPVVRTAPSSRTLAASLPPVLRERGRLPLAGAPRRLELLLQLLATALPAVPLLDQLRLVSFQAFDAQVPRVSPTSRSVRIVPIALLAVNGHRELTNSRHSSA